MAGMASLITSNSFSNINVPAGTIKNLDITDVRLQNKVNYLW